jgi:hypothetical protein
MIDPSEETIERIVLSVKYRTAVLNMSHESLSDVGTNELTLMADGGKFMLMLSEVDPDGEPQVRTLTNLEAPNILVTIHGEKYPARAIVSDIAPVIAAFKEFAMTGNVSPTLLT